MSAPQPCLFASQNKTGSMQFKHGTKMSVLNKLLLSHRDFEFVEVRPLFVHHGFGVLIRRKWQGVATTTTASAWALRRLRRGTAGGTLCAATATRPTITMASASIATASNGVCRGGGGRTR